MGACLGVDPELVRENLVDGTPQQRKDLLKKVRALMEDDESLCVAEKLGVVVDGAMSKQGAEDYIRKNFVNKDLVDEAVRLSDECFNITSGCSTTEVRQQVGLYMGCMRRKLGKPLQQPQDQPWYRHRPGAMMRRRR